MKNIRKNKLFLCLASCIFFVSPIYAQQTSQKNDIWDMSLEQLMDVEIRTAATLTEKNPLKSPSAVTVIDAEDIALTPARNLLDLMEIYVPGAIYMNHSIGQVPGIRGNLVDRPYQYLVTVNGINVNYLAHYGARLELLNWDLNDIERIEIVRGPGSVTYGPGAIGGVINITTKKAKNAPGAQLGGFFWDKYNSIGQYASYGYQSSKLDLFAYFSIVNTDGHDPMLYSVDSNTRYGYLGQQTGGSSSPPSTYMADFYNEPQIKAHVDIDFKNSWRFWARYVTSNTALTQSGAVKYLIDGTYKDFRQTRHRYMEYALEKTTKLTDSLSLKSLYAVGSKDTFDIQKYSSSIFNDKNNLQNIGWIWSETSLYTRQMLDYQDEDFLKSALGAEYRYDMFRPAWEKHRTDGLRMSEAIISGPDSDAYGTGYRQYTESSSRYFAVGDGWETHSYALFGEANIQFHPKTSLLLAGRVDQHSYTDYMFSPRAAVMYEMTPKNYLKFIVQRSVRMNTAEELYMNHQTNIENNPEKLDSFELMYDGKWFETIDMKSSVFLNKNEVVAWDGTRSAMVGELKTFGFEWEGNYKNDNFELGVNHSYVKQLDWTLGEGISSSGVSYSDYYYNAGSGVIITSNGNDLANWPTQATKLFSNIHLLEKKITLHGDMRVIWGFEGAQDGLDALQRAGGSLAAINNIRAHDAYNAELTANISLTYHINKSADLTLFVQNIPVIGDNKRYSYSSGFKRTYPDKASWVEEPTVFGLKYYLRF